MKVIAVNGSPRKEKWNTVTLLNNALEGAASVGADTEMVHLYDLIFSGCVSCFACKKIDRKQDGVCVLKDDLTPILDLVREADALLIGTPVYYHAESAATRAFLERLFFPYNKYAKDFKSLFPKKIKTGLIYTMNITEEMANNSGYDKHFAMTKWALETTFGECELMLCTDTLQYEDYDRYESEAFDGTAKLKRHKEVFLMDCKRAFDLGVRLAS
jgi:multimeric flavodoxin WrbA